MSPDRGYSQRRRTCLTQPSHSIHTSVTAWIWRLMDEKTAFDDPSMCSEDQDANNIRPSIWLNVYDVCKFKVADGAGPHKARMS